MRIYVCDFLASHHLWIPVSFLLKVQECIANLLRYFWSIIHPENVMILYGLKSIFRKVHFGLLKVSPSPSSFISILFGILILSMSFFRLLNDVHRRIYQDLTWIFGFTFAFHFLLTNEIIYNIKNQICQLRLYFSVSIIYMASFAYIIPVLLTFIVYVRCMNQYIAPVNVLSRVKKVFVYVYFIISIHRSIERCN
mgnify:CR=1 FL=1